MTKQFKDIMFTNDDITQISAERALARSCFGRYLDFALVDEKIDIEVDGQAWHLDRNGCTKADDIHRDLLLEINGWRVVRVWHHEVMNDVDACVRKVMALVRGENNA